MPLGKKLRVASLRDEAAPLIFEAKVIFLVSVHITDDRGAAVAKSCLKAVDEDKYGGEGYDARTEVEKGPRGYCDPRAGRALEAKCTATHTATGDAMHGRLSACVGNHQSAEYT